MFLHRKTPVEVLHTLLLGPVKYLLAATIKGLTPEEKQKLHVKTAALDMSCLERRIRGNITKTYGSFVGRDFKLWMQVAAFTLQDLISEEHLTVWVALSEVFNKSIFVPTSL